MRKSLVFIIVMCSICLCCNKKPDLYHIIDIESIVNKMEKVNLSDLIDSIYYLRIKLPDSISIRSIQKIACSGEFIFISDLENCFLIDKNGNFIRKIGAKGRGPNDYKYVNQIGITPDGTLLIQSMYDLIKYKCDGTILEIKKGYFQREKNFIGSWIVLNDSVVCGKIAFYTGQEKSKAVLINLNGNLIAEIDNNFFVNRSFPVLNDFEINAIQTLYKGKLFFKEGYNDTLYRLEENDSFLPELVIKTGMYSQNIFTGNRDEFDDYLKQEFEKITLENIFITDHFYLLDFQFNKNFPAKRLTPRNLAPGITSFYNTSHILGLYDKFTSNMILCKPLSTDNPLCTTGVSNDYDGGPNFFPDYQVDDSTLVMFLNVSDLKEYLLSSEFMDNKPKNPEKKKNLIDFINSLTENENYVLMYCIISVHK